MTPPSQAFGRFVPGKGHGAPPETSRASRPEPGASATLAHAPQVSWHAPPVRLGLPACRSGTSAFAGRASAVFGGVPGAKLRFCKANGCVLQPVRSACPRHGAIAGAHSASREVIELGVSHTRSHAPLRKEGGSLTLSETPRQTPCFWGQRGPMRSTVGDTCLRKSCRWSLRA